MARMEDCQNSSMISKIPDDCLFLIFQKIDDSRDRNSFGLTCHKWLHIQNYCRKSLVLPLRQDPKVQTYYIEYLPRLIRRFPRLSSISLTMMTEMPDLSLSILGDSGASLLCLLTYTCPGITNDSLAQVSVCFPNLVTLSLYRCSITDIGLMSVAKSCHNLENLNISRCSITDCGIDALIKSCLKLHVLIISYCRKITGIGFEGCQPSLSYLEAEGCFLTTEGISKLVSGRGLEYLDLQHLRDGYGAKDCLAGIGSEFARNLRFLNLRLCRFMGDDSVTAISKGCPVLENWNLDLCHEVRVPGWTALASNCKKLKTLHVNRCRNLCDQSLLALQNGCQRLEELYMHGCPRLTESALELFRMMRLDVVLKPEECMYIGPRIDLMFKDQSTPS